MNNDIEEILDNLKEENKDLQQKINEILEILKNNEIKKQQEEENKRIENILDTNIALCKRGGI